MAAASGEKDGFPLGPQLFLPFRRRAASSRPGVPLIFVYVHKEFVLFCVHGLFLLHFTNS